MIVLKYGQQSTVNAEKAGNALKYEAVDAFAQHSFFNQPSHATLCCTVMYVTWGALTACVSALERS